MLRRSHSSIQNVDIQLYENSGRDNNIVLLSGPPLEASANPLTGQIVLSTLDSTSIRKITVKIVGTLRLRWNDTSAVRSSTTPPERFHKHLYTQEFSGFQLPGKQVHASAVHPRATPAGSLSNLASYFSGHHKHKSINGSSSHDSSPIPSRPQSTTNLAAMASAGSSSGNSAGSGSNKVHQVPSGTYRFPFSLTIPGDINESIEGNKYAQLSYWLVATVERGMLQHDLTAKKHIRIVRTIGVDSYDVAHTVTIENTWPGKVEYKITVPCKAVPVGSQLEVQFAMVPLDKGLRLGRIRAEIVEYVSLATPATTAREEQHVVAQQFFETPENFDHFADEWELVKFMDVPRSLSRCTQDVMIPPYTKINHKFRCFISLINRDGHTSELRASLPITLYISPNIYVLGSNDGTPQTSSKHKHSAAQQEQPMFNVEPRPRSGQTTPSGLSSEADSAAPPVYSHHVYDRLYSTVASPVESPTQSGTVTPHMGPSRPGSPPSMSNLDPGQQAQLVAGLRALALSRQNSSQSIPQLGSAGGSQVDLAALSRVPSYDQALNEPVSEDPVPEYTD